MKFCDKKHLLPVEEWLAHFFVGHGAPFVVQHTLELRNL